MRKAVFFDLDHTLLKGNSDRIFIGYLIDRGKLNIFSLIDNFLIFAIKNNYINIPYACKKYKGYLKGKDVKQIDKLAERCFNEKIKNRFNYNVVSELRKYKRKGYKIIIITGALETLAKHVKSYLKADNLISTKIKIKNSKYTGDISGKHPFHETKKNIIKDYCRKNKIKIENTVGFADGLSDLPMLKTVGKAFIVTSGIIIRADLKNSK